MIIDDYKFAKLVGKFLDVPYKLGGKDFNGMDCVSFIYLFYHMYGIKLPDEFNGYTMNNYVDEYLNSGNRGKNIFAQYIRSFTSEKHSMSKGDILILHKNDSIDFGIYTGKGNMLFNDYRIGNVVVPIDATKYDKIEIRRID